jgi:DNA-binding NarL/FixJ family response regulator
VSNKAIGVPLVITEAAVRKHVGAIFAKLHLRSGDDAHRRMLAVLVYLSRQRQDESIGM